MAKNNVGALVYSQKGDGERPEIVITVRPTDRRADAKRVWNEVDEVWAVQNANQDTTAETIAENLFTRMKALFTGKGYSAQVEVIVALGDDEGRTHRAHVAG
jgi:hypothetical protein